MTTGFTLEIKFQEFIPVVSLKSSSSGPRIEDDREFHLCMILYTAHALGRLLAWVPSNQIEFTIPL